MIRFLILFFISASLHAHTVTFSINDVKYEYKEKSEVVLVRNRTDIDIIVQLWRDNEVHKTFNLSRKSDKTLRVLGKFKYDIVGMSPPSRKIRIKNL